MSQRLPGLSVDDTASRRTQRPMHNIHSLHSDLDIWDETEREETEAKKQTQAGRVENTG